MKYDEPDTGNAEIELRMDSAENALYRYSKKLFNHSIAIKTRVRIMNSIGLWLSDMGTDKTSTKKNEVCILGNSS